MRKWRIKSRKILATLLAAVMLLVMIPTTLVDTATADMTYVEQDGWFYFWDEQGLKDILTANADSEWIPMRFAASQSELDDSTGTMTLNSSVTIPAEAYVHMRDGQLKVAALRKLTVQGTLVTRVDRAVTGSVSVEGDGVYCKYSDVTDGVSLVSELKKLGDMAAAGDVAKDLEVSVMADVTVNGDLTVPAGVCMYLDEGKTLQVSGALTVKKDAVVGNYGVLKAASVNIEQGGSMSYGEGAELDYGSQLTVNGGFYGFGTVRGTGSLPSIVIGGTAEVDNYGAGSISADVWSVNATATINNYGVLVVPLAQRASLVSGTNISYNAKDGDNGTGSVQYAVRLTDTEAGKAGVLQNAINTFDTITGKKDYELFAVSVSNAVKGQPMQLTLNENVTVDGAVDCLFLTQNDWPEDETGFAPHVTIGEGAALTVAAGRTLSVNVPVTVNGTLDIRNEGSFTFGTPGIVVLQDGMTLNGTVLTAGLLEVYGDVAVAEGGVLHQTMGSVRIEGSLTVNGTMIVDMVDFQIKGSYTKGANATVTIGENANFNYQAKTTFNRDALLAAFAQENVSTVTVDMTEDVTLTEDLTIPKEKTLVINGYGTLTIAPGATLALEGTVEADWEKDIDGGQLKCGAPMVIRGTFSVGNKAYANPDGDVSVENDGKLIMAGSAYFGGRSFVVKAGGHVTNNGWMSFTEGAAITVEDDWAAVWTQGEGAETNIDVVAALEQGDNADQKIQKALADINASTLPDFFSYTLSVYRQDDGERIELTQDVTIPTGVMLAFYNEGVMTYIAKGAALTVQGGLYSEAPITVDGKLTVSASGYANVYNNLLVGGTLTVDEDGRMYCQYLTDENEQGKAGTIVNNGSLAAEQFDLKHNEVDIGGGGDDGSKVVYSLEALKSALAEGGQIDYRGTELTISEDLTIPENVNLTINVTTFTVNEGVTLTNKGNVWLYGDACLYGKLDVSNEGGYIWGYGLVKAGGEDNLVRDEYGNRWFNWTSRISKEGASETLTQEELTAAGASVLADGIEINLGSQTTLTLADGLEIRDKNVSIGGANAAKVVVNGPLSVWNNMNLDVPMELNGTVDVYGSVYASRDITVNTGGKLHVHNYYNGSEHRQWTGSVEFENNAWIALPEGAAWDDYVTVDDGCRLGVNRTVNADNLESFLQSCNDGRDYIVTLHMNRHEGESVPLYIATGTTLTIPENVELAIYDLTVNGYDTIIIGAADESGNKGEVIVNGSLRISMPAQVDGTLTISGEMRAVSGDTTTVNGAMTVNEGGTVQFSRLAGTGTITNNGTLTANEKAVGTVIGGSGKTMIDNTRLEASNMAELKAALSSLSGSAERQTIFLCRSAMDDAAPYFVIDEDITVPSGVELRMDEMQSSSFRGLTVAKNAKLTIAGDVYCWAEDGVTVNGTLKTLHGGQDEDGNGISNGRIAAYSVTVASTGNLVNGGNTDVNDRDEQTGGILAVEGKMENSGYINCRDLKYSGTEMTNKGNIYVRQQLKIAEGSVIENTGWITYGDCDALDKINNSENATIRWNKTVNTVEELRALLTRTENGTATLDLREDCALNEDLTVPGNIELVLAAEYERTSTLTVPEGVTLSANGQLNIKDSATLAVNGTLATSNDVQVNGALLISESGVWQQENWASVSNDGASITINGRLEQSESWVELTSRWNGKIIFGANAHWNEVGTISSRESSTAITGFDTGKYKLSTNDGINYYLERLSGGGSSSGGETSTIGDVNGDGVVDQADLVALARFMAGIDDLEDTTRADINGDGIYSAADLTALARMLEAQQGTQTADADENGAPVDTGAELNADAQDTVQTEDGGAPVEPAPVVDDVPETVEESVTGEVPQTEAGEQAA
mgnify:CR=1 FL=1